MKNLKYLLMLFYIPSTDTIPSSVVAGPLAILATAPVTVPGTYYWHKTKKERAALSSPATQYHPKNDMRRPFLSGALLGAMPGVNLVVGGLVVGGVVLGSPIWLPEVLFSDEKILKQSEKATCIGFIGAASLYATIPAALYYAMKCARR